MKQTPMFFIVGVPRSGTTLLSVFLGNHPDIYMERRNVSFRIITIFKHAHRLIKHGTSLQDPKFVKWLINNDPMGMTQEFFRDFQFEDQVDLVSAITEVIQTKQSNAGCQIWGDKAPQLQHWVDDAMYFFPGAKFVHIIRDGRAVASSLHRRSYQHRLVSAQEWVDGNLKGLEHQQKIGKERYLIVKYEDLVSDPKTTLEQVCQFLNVPFHDDVLKLDDQELVSQDRYVKETPLKNKIDAWKEALTDQQIQSIEKIQGPTLMKFGYPLSCLNDSSDFQNLNPFLRSLYRMKNNFVLLFRSKREGMNNRAMVAYTFSFKAQFRKLIKDLLLDILPKHTFHQIYHRNFYLERKYKSKQKP